MEARPRRLAAVTVGPVLLAALVACSGAHQGDAKAFCARLHVEAPRLTGSPTDAAGRKAVVDAFHRLAPLAPAVITDDWRRLTALMDKLATYDPATSDPFGDVYAAALDPKVQDAATHVRNWAQVSCGLDLAVAAGPPTTGSPATVKP